MQNRHGYFAASAPPPPGRQHFQHNNTYADNYGQDYRNRQTSRASSFREESDSDHFSSRQQPRRQSQNFRRNNQYNYRGKGREHGYGRGGYDRSRTSYRYAGYNQHYQSRQSSRARSRSRSIAHFHQRQSSESRRSRSRFTANYRQRQPSESRRSRSRLTANYRQRQRYHSHTSAPLKPLKDKIKLTSDISTTLEKIYSDIMDQKFADDSLDRLPDIDIPAFCPNLFRHEEVIKHDSSFIEIASLIDHLLK